MLRYAIIIGIIQEQIWPDPSARVSAAGPLGSLVGTGASDSKPGGAACSAETSFLLASMLYGSLPCWTTSGDSVHSVHTGASARSSMGGGMLRTSHRSCSAGAAERVHREVGRPVQAHDQVGALPRAAPGFKVALALLLGPVHRQREPSSKPSHA